MRTISRLQVPIAVLLMCYALSTSAQPSTNTLSLRSQDWGLRESVYHFASVDDERKDRSSAGSITGAGPAQTLRFEQSLQADLSSYVKQCMLGDTARVGLILGFDKFYVKETRSGPRRNIQFEFQLRIYREIDGQRIQLYQVGGTPSYVVHGANPDIYDKLIGGSLKQALSGFDRWAKENRNQPPLCKHLRIALVDDLAYRDTVANDTLRWSSQYRLRWEDFKGPADLDNPFSANSACVFIFSTRPSYTQDTLVLEVLLHPAFTKPASWVKPDKKETGLLGHEQLHFDICELYGRRMRAGFLKTSPGLLNYDQVLKQVFEAEWQAYQARQADYDRETEHGLIPERQADWVKTISEELATLDAFSSD